MGVREDIKSLLAKECYTVKRIAEEMATVSGKNFTAKGLSQKLANGTLRYDEYKLIVDILGYEIQLIKK